MLSARGIGPADVKVMAAAGACERTNAAEVRSFLGLVNFTARFIPDLATVSAPPRQLTKNGEPFVWGPDQQQSFGELKKRLYNAEQYFFIHSHFRQVTEDRHVHHRLLKENNWEIYLINWSLNAKGTVRFSS